MGREAIAQHIRQVINQGRIAEMIFAAPIMAVLLNRIPAIRREQHQSPTRFQNTHHFLNRHAVISDVFDHFVGDDGIKKIRPVG